MKSLAKILFILLSSVSMIAALTVSSVANEPDQATWLEIGREASEFVAHESPDATFPFLTTVNRPLLSPRKVFIHYFPFFQNSFDNLAPDIDLWSSAFLARDGEGGKWRNAGGMVRERPLPSGPWHSLYWRQINIAVDALRARRIGADGFGYDLPTGPTGDPVGWSQAQMVCKVIDVVAPSFSFVIEPDAPAMKNFSEDEMALAIRSLSACSATARTPDGVLLLVPFSPEIKPSNFWEHILSNLSMHRLRVAFIPDFVSENDDSKRLLSLSSAMSNWGARDPLQVSGRPLVAREHPELGWMQPIAPQDARPKTMQFWEAGNTETFRAAWMVAIKGNADYVHLLTWNDYGEGTEIGPSSGTQFLFYDLTAFYIEWYKSRAMPKITRDAIYYDHRTQVFQPDRPVVITDMPFRRMGPTNVRNRVEMIAMLTKPATLEIELAGRHEHLDVDAGLQVFTIDAVPGRPSFRILRDKRVVAEVTSNWEIAVNPDTANPLYYGGSSTRRITTAQVAR